METPFEIVPDKEIPNLISIPYEIYSKVFCSQEDSQVTSRKEFVIQGKSSCYPAWILMKPLITKKLQNKKFDVLDACAAPGNKTLQLAEYLQEFPGAKLFACEKNKARFDLLNQRIHHYEVNIQNLELMFADFLSINPEDPKFKNTKFILLDPSCSGSGMRIHLFLNENSENEFPTDFEQICKKKIEELDKKSIERVNKLQNFQIKILSHALKFPHVMRVCYSTCSLYMNENEMVVESALKSNKDFNLVNLKKRFKGLNCGFGQKGKKCLRANPFSEETDGFFIALFKRKRKE